MALDGLLLHTITDHLHILEGGKIGKIQNLSDEEILFHIHTPKNGNQRLVINVHSNTNRIYIHEHSIDVAPAPTNFVMFLRKYISQGIITKISQIDFDRIVKIEMKGHNELGDTKNLVLYAELMGKYANLVLVGEDHRIMDVLKRIPVFENSKRLIHPGAQYVLPAREVRLDPEKTEDSMIDLDIPLTKQIEGFSPLISREFVYRIHNGERFEKIMHQLLSSNTLYVYDDKNFHAIPLLHLDKEYKSYDLMDGLDHLYEQNEAKTRIREQCGDVFRTVNKEKTKHEKKLPKLEKALQEAQDLEKYRKYGDLLFAYMYDAKKEKTIQLEDFETGKTINIPIDMRYDLKTNANKYYQKYHKMKRSLDVIKEQIEQCREDIAYFAQLQEQLDHCSPADALEIREELIKNRYLMPNKSATRKKKAKNPHVLHLRAENADIYVGKNNIQNNYITHHLSRKNDLWFHVKDYHGSHVLLKCEEATEELIRMCAQLATYFSKGKMSSSVPVDYTRISQLKKVPGSKIGFVTMKTYKTIYIDPDPETIESWINRYEVK